MATVTPKGAATAKIAKRSKKIKARSRKREISENERKWGSATHEFGFTFVPNLLLEHQSELELKPIHLNIILTILKHWWQKDKRAWPSVPTVAASIGRSRSLVQRRIAELEKRGLIRRIPRKDASKEK